MRMRFSVHTGIPSHGNDRNAWNAGCRFDYENPEHRA